MGGGVLWAGEGKSCHAPPRCAELRWAHSQAAMHGGETGGGQVVAACCGGVAAVVVEEEEEEEEEEAVESCKRCNRRWREEGGLKVLISVVIILKLELLCPV